MTQSSNGWFALITTAVVAIGLAVVWGFVSIWVGSMTMASSLDRYSEFAIGAEGEVYITSRSYKNWEDVESRTLSGEPVDLSNRNTLGFTYFHSTDLLPWPLAITPSWRERVLGASNQAKPPEAWYLVRDPGSDGAACFEVFDYQIKRRIGYFGKEGMRRNRPPRDEWFRLGAGALNSKVGTTGYAGQGQYANPRYNHGRGLIEPWQWLVSDGDDVLFIDMQEKTISKALSLSGLKSVTTVTSPYGWLPAKVDWSKLREQAGDGGPSIEEGTREVVSAIVNICGAWNGERIVFWNPATGKETAFDLPDELSHASTLQAAWWGDEQILLRKDKGNWGGGPLVGLYWVNAKGEIERTEQVELPGQPPEGERTIAWLTSGVAPSPTVATTFMLAAPMSDLATGKSKTYGEAFRRWFNEIAPPFGVVYLIGFLGAAFVWRQHTKSHREHGWRWALMALLVGPAGVIAYWLHWRGQPRTACDDCGERVSRRNEACPACGAGWATPGQLGIEVFA